MKTEDIRKILALQAIEQTNEESEILSDSDFREAAGSAGAPLPKKASSQVENSFLAKRAELLLIRATSRAPAAAQWAMQLPANHRAGFVALMLFLVAAILGFLSNELGPEKRINILSFPLLGILLWSLLIYLRELVLLFRDPARLFTGSWVEWIVDLLHPGGTAHDPGEKESLAGARLIFDRRWRRLTAPVTGARLKSVLHTTALILAAAAIAGMYFKGLANEYRAVWESTFFSESTQLRPFLTLVLGPATALTGGSLPTAAELDLIHWKAGKDELPGENAARWIHWYAITIGLFVILPRGILALFWRARASHFSRHLPFREVSPDYFAHLLAVSSGTSVSLSLAPYPASPDESVRRRILRELEDHFSKPIEIDWLAAVPFGSEEEPVPEIDHEIVPLFDFAATPEKETHLALYHTLSNAGPNPVRLILLEASGFARKTQNLPDADERFLARRQAWQNLFEEENVEILPFSHEPKPGPAPTS